MHAIRRFLTRGRTLAQLLAVIALLTAGGVAANALAATPSDAPPSTASFTAVDFAFNAAGGGTSVTIAPGGTVTFSYPKGISMHNVDFGSGPQPSSCTDNGAPASAPVPATPQAQGWTVTCTFKTVGTYAFFCDMHSHMTGTVVVANSLPTPPQPPTSTTTPSTPPSTSTTTPSGTPPAGGTSSTMTMPMAPGSTMTTPASTTKPPATVPALLVGSATKAIRFGTRQTGTKVTGAVALSSAAVRAHLKVSLLTTAHTLKSSTASRRLVSIGGTSVVIRHAGTQRFALTLSRSGISAEKRLHRVAVTVQIVLAPTTGRRLTATRKVSLAVRAH